MTKWPLGTLKFRVRLADFQWYMPSGLLFRNVNSLKTGPPKYGRPC